MQYQQAIRSAFGEVRTALIAQARARESYDAESARAAALTETLRLARLRYQNGVASQLDVIDAERGLLQAQIARIDALRAAPRRGRRSLPGARRLAGPLSLLHRRNGQEAGSRPRFTFAANPDQNEVEQST